MESVTKLNLNSYELKESLEKITNPKNSILARLQNCIAGNKNDHRVCGYSRMHNRHNRS